MFLFNILEKLSVFFIIIYFLTFNYFLIIKYNQSHNKTKK